jgi:hypothetical protein
MWLVGRVVAADVNRRVTANQSTANGECVWFGEASLILRRYGIGGLRSCLSLLLRASIRR